MTDHINEGPDRVRMPLIRAIEIGLVLVLLVSPVLISTTLKQVFNTPKYALVGFVALIFGCMHLVACACRPTPRAGPCSASWPGAG